MLSFVRLRVRRGAKRSCVLVSPSGTCDERLGSVNQRFVAAPGRGRFERVWGLAAKRRGR
ncbi:hypothetical protein SPHINGO361_120027 [Sphingomonas sp. EC-HK361]|nr:hypothetical protein SPHINGO361_120027 [Sphingomonas sp. EC-HK361]